MTDKPLSISRIKQLELLAAGLCSLCKAVRTEVEGYTRNLCAKCAERDRVRKRVKYRKRKDIDVSAPVIPYNRSSKENEALPVEQVAAQPKQAKEAKRVVTKVKKAKRKELPAVRRQRKIVSAAIESAPVVKTHYGSLSIEDIASATSTLPLKPPGK